MKPAALLPPKSKQPCPCVPPVALKLIVSALAVWVAPDEIVPEDVELALLTTHVPDDTVTVGAARIGVGSGRKNICVELVG